MARRRYIPQGSGRPFRRARRQTFWIDCAVEPSVNLTAAGTTRVVTLFDQTLDEETSFTLLRLIGRVTVEPQAAPGANTLVPIYHGIQVVRVNEPVVPPSTAAGISDEAWLHWNSIVFNDGTIARQVSVENAFPMLDIRVKRKLNNDNRLLWAGNCAAAWASLVNFRGLFMRSAGT